MDQATLKAEARTRTGKGSARTARREGKIPAVVYSHFAEPVAIAVDPVELRKAVTGSEHGFNTVLKIELNGGGSKTALLKEWQVDPVSRQLLHADFLEIKMDERLSAEVPVNLKGRAQGVIDGGVLSQIRRVLTVRCLPGKIPLEIAIDVSKMKINDVLHVSDLTPPEGVEIPYNNDFTIVVIAAPEGAEAEAPAAAPAAGAPAAAEEPKKE
jgi:large subunit ribosomal protein L25